MLRELLISAQISFVVFSVAEEATLTYTFNSNDFVGAERELRNGVQAFNTNLVHTEVLQRDVNCHFSSPTASHQGGVWERLIRLKRSNIACTCNY